MEFVHEVTAYLENKPGRLAKICSALAHEKLDIKALSVMDKSDRSVFRFVTDDLEPTRKVLTSLGVEFSSAEVLAVPMDNQPGAPRSDSRAARGGTHQRRVCLCVEPRRRASPSGSFRRRTRSAPCRFSTETSSMGPIEPGARPTAAEEPLLPTTTVKA